MLSLQKEQDVLDRKMVTIHDRQEQMVKQEARALEELDTFTELDPVGQLALMSNFNFSTGAEITK